VHRVTPFVAAFVLVLSPALRAQNPADSAEAPAAPADTMSVGWDTQVTQLGPMIEREVTPGERLAIVCPAKGGTGSAVWGTDIYTDDSSICVAAVHAGLISSRDGGMVVVKILPGRPEYPASERHGVTTQSWGEWNRSFEFVIPDQGVEE
jgi:hypothetical protein